MTLSRALPALCLLALAPLVGCGVAADSGAVELADGGAQGGGLGELVPAAVGAVEVPARVAPGEAAQVVVRGVHPDGCTTFDRFETARSGTGVSVRAYASRPLGPCGASVGAPFEERLALAGLAPGVYRVEVNGAFPRDLVVAGQVVAPGTCADAAPLTPTRVVLPPATWPGGRAVVHVEGTLPSWCHALDAPVVTRAGGRVSIALTGASCGLAEDAAACPPGAQPVSVDVDVAPLDVGSFEVEVGGRTWGALEVVPEAQCRLRTLAVGAVDLPSPAAADDPPTARVVGALRSACAALDPVTVAGDAATLDVTVPVRECEAECLPADRPVSLAVPLPGLAPGDYAVAVNEAAPRPLTVLAAGACTTEALPAAALGDALVTSEGLDPGRAGAPLDLTVYGTLPSACWRAPALDATAEGGVVALTATARTCEGTCAAAGAPFVAGLAFPGGLAAGHWSVQAGGQELAAFDLR